jgi:tRNA 2-thiouridine synthesizing protein A
MRRQLMTEIDILSVTVDDELDACGLFCPEPVMMLHNVMRKLTAGAMLRVVATDPSTQRDIPKFCHFLGHELRAEQISDGKYFYLICKK